MERTAIASILVSLFLLLTAAKATADDGYKKDLCGERKLKSACR